MSCRLDSPHVRLDSPTKFYPDRSRGYCGWERPNAAWHCPTFFRHLDTVRWSQEEGFFFIVTQNVSAMHFGTQYVTHFEETSHVKESSFCGSSHQILNRAFLKRLTLFYDSLSKTATNTGRWLSHPSEKYDSQLGWWHSQYMENKPVMFQWPPTVEQGWE